MISDVLAESAKQIKRRQQEMPQCYARTRLEIASVLDVMDALREVYDRLPSDKVELDAKQENELIARFWERFTEAAKGEGGNVEHKEPTGPELDRKVRLSFPAIG